MVPPPPITKVSKVRLLILKSKLVRSPRGLRPRGGNTISNCIYFLIFTFTFVIQSWSDPFWTFGPKRGIPISTHNFVVWLHITIPRA